MVNFICFASLYLFQIYSGFKPNKDWQWWVIFIVGYMVIKDGR